MLCRSSRTLLCCRLAMVYPSHPSLVACIGAWPWLSTGVSVSPFLRHLGATYSTRISSNFKCFMLLLSHTGRELSAKAAIERYFWSITPSLIAFPAVTLPPLGSSLVIAGTLGAVSGPSLAFHNIAKMAALAGNCVIVCICICV